MINFDLRKLTDKLVKLQAVTTQLPQIAQQAQAEALGHMIVSSEANIYRTQPGKYVRSGWFRQGLNARSRATRFTAQVTVLNEVDYAAAVEVGRQGMSFAMLQQLAVLQADPSKPLTLGRSGVNWQAAAPVVTGAQVYAAWKMQRLFADAVKRALK